VSATVERCTAALPETCLLEVGDQLVALRIHTVNFTCGEPLLRRNAVDLMEYARSSCTAENVVVTRTVNNPATLDGVRANDLAKYLAKQSFWTISRCYYSDEGVGQFLGGGVPFVGAEEATQFQAGGTVNTGQEYGRAALRVLNADDGGNDGEELVAHAFCGADDRARIGCRGSEHQSVQVWLPAADRDDADERRAQLLGG